MGGTRDYGREESRFDVLKDTRSRSPSTTLACWAAMASAASWTVGSSTRAMRRSEGGPPALCSRVEMNLILVTGPWSAKSSERSSSVRCPARFDTWRSLDGSMEGTLRAPAPRYRWRGEEEYSPKSRAPSSSRSERFAWTVRCLEVAMMRGRPQSGHPESDVRAFSACSGASNWMRAESRLLYRILMRAMMPHVLKRLKRASGAAR
mmetsp:Transcript_58879/g.120476  ORF Transcript_58879/g.120476 Transcript_58879/m.120476 type:complete len:206 (-) Transcript_58879:32-649(-)